jgi:hypothetical protein
MELVSLHLHACDLVSLLNLSGQVFHYREEEVFSGVFTYRFYLFRRRLVKIVRVLGLPSLAFRIVFIWREVPRLHKTIDPWRVQGCRRVERRVFVSLHGEEVDEIVVLESSLSGTKGDGDREVRE